MKKWLFPLLATLTFSAQASDFSESFKFFGINSDSQIHGPNYQGIIDELKDLEKSYPGEAQVITYGTSVAGRPLTLIKIGSKKETTLPAIYIGGTIHGDEYLNIEDRLPRWFLEQTRVPGSAVANYLAKGGMIYVAPILNPDGYEKRVRTNSKGKDLNRDFTSQIAQVEGFTQPETTNLVTFLKEDLARDKRKLEVAMDYHCCIGALLYPWSFKGPVIPEADLSRHAQVGEIMQDALSTQVRYGQTFVILGYEAKGTSKDFYFETFGARGFTYEGRRGMEDKFFDEHTKMWDNIVRLIH